jgi:ribosome-associated protein
MEGLEIGEHTIPEQELVEIFSTSGGPGGQHSNRSETAVRLRFDITVSTLPEEVRATLLSRLGEVVEVTSSESRSQFRNRALARQRLREKLEAALVEHPKRRKTRPSRAAKEKRVDQKKARGETKRLRRNPSPDD